MSSKSVKHVFVGAALALLLACSTPETPPTADAKTARPTPAPADSPAPASAPAEEATPAPTLPPGATLSPEDAVRQSRENLLKIANAILNFEADKRVFPRRVIAAADGKPLLSWRVAILPHLGEEKLYAEFHLDEPWDSPHNKPLVERMPAVYDSPMTDAGPGLTNYLALAGENAVLVDDEDVTNLSISDGASNTAMVVEANESKPWTSPEDYTWTSRKPAAGLGKLHPADEFLIATADARVRFVSMDSQPHEFKAIFTRNGGDPVDWGRQPDP